MKRQYDKGHESTLLSVQQKPRERDLQSTPDSLPQNIFTRLSAHGTVCPLMSLASLFPTIACGQLSSPGSLSHRSYPCLFVFHPSSQEVILCLRKEFDLKNQLELDLGQVT